MADIAMRGLNYETGDMKQLGVDPTRSDALLISSGPIQMVDTQITRPGSTPTYTVGEAIVGDDEDSPLRPLEIGRRDGVGATILYGLAETNQNAFAGKIRAWFYSSDTVAASANTDAADGQFHGGLNLIGYLDFNNWVSSGSHSAAIAQPLYPLLAIPATESKLIYTAFQVTQGWSAAAGQTLTVRLAVQQK